MTDTTFTYDVTDGGVLLRFASGDGIDLTTPSENPLQILANIDRVSSLLADLAATTPAILAELAKARAEIGNPCTTCEGTGGQEIPGALEWANCPACNGNRVQAAAA